MTVVRGLMLTRTEHVRAALVGTRVGLLHIYVEHLNLFWIEVPRVLNDKLLLLSILVHG